MKGSYCWGLSSLSGAHTGPTNVREPMLGPDQSVRGTHRAYKCQGANAGALPVRQGHLQGLQMPGSQCWGLTSPSGAPTGPTNAREPMLLPDQSVRGTQGLQTSGSQGRDLTSPSGAPTGPRKVREPMLGPVQSARGTHRA
jgi:hypothetical protein